MIPLRTTAIFLLEEIKGSSNFTSAGFRYTYACICVYSHAYARKYEQDLTFHVARKQMLKAGNISVKLKGETQKVYIFTLTLTSRIIYLCKVDGGK